MRRKHIGIYPHRADDTRALRNIEEALRIQGNTHGATISTRGLTPAG